MRLRAEDLRLPAPAVIGRVVECLERVGSTQDVVRERARLGAPEGYAVFAEAQTAGRGRLGRSWVSPPGRGLWFSVLLRPGFGGDRLPALTLAAGVALARACRRAAGVAPELKWPNDLLWRGRKLGGILAELVTEPSGNPSVVLGVGLNVDLDRGLLPPELRDRVASLAEAAGAPVDRTALARHALGQLDEAYRLMRQSGFAALREEWKGLAAFLGRPVRISGPDGSWSGTALDVDADGALLVAVPGGVRRVLAGEVSLRSAALPFEPFGTDTDNMLYDRAIIPRRVW